MGGNFAKLTTIDFSKYHETWPISPPHEIISCCLKKNCGFSMSGKFYRVSHFRVVTL